MTMQEIRDAFQQGQLTLKKKTMFFLRRYNDSLFKPTVIIKAGVVVGVEKVYCRGRAAMLRYTDRSGKVWWSWTHASEYEPRRKYTRKKL